MWPRHSSPSKSKIFRSPLRAPCDLFRSLSFLFRALSDLGPLRAARVAK